MKILMQTSAVVKGTEGKYTSLSGTMRAVMQAEGVRGLWRGNLTNCVRVVPHTATQFVAYEKYKGMIVSDGADVGMAQQTAQRLLTGALSGMTAATITHPLDVVRIRLQTTPGIDSVREARAARRWPRGSALPPSAATGRRRCASPAAAIVRVASLGVRAVLVPATRPLAHAAWVGRRR